jgi:hypothetical protein
MDNYDYSEGNIFASNDEGTASAPTVNGDSTAGEPSAAPQTDAAIGTQEQPITEPAREVPDETAAAALSEEDKARLAEEYLDQLKAEGRQPGWFENYRDNVYKPKLDELGAKAGSWESSLSDYGKTPEEIATKLAQTKVGDWQNNPQTGMPEFTTRPWVEEQYKQDPKVVTQLIKDAALLDSPYNPGRKIVHEILDSQGIDPAKLELHRKFAENGYQLTANQNGASYSLTAEEQQAIPPGLHAAYASLTEAERSLIEPYASENEAQIVARNSMLQRTADNLANDQQKQLDEQQEEQWARQQKWQEEQTFRNEVAEQGAAHYEQSGDRILTSFVDDLVAQSGLPKSDAIQFTNTLLTAIEGRGSAGKLSLADLEENGIKLDPAIAPLMSELEKVDSLVAYFAHPKVNNTVERDSHINRAAEIERQLILKGQPIIAAMVQHRANARAGIVTQQNDALAKANEQNLQVQGEPARIGSGVNPANGDYSDDSYLKGGLFKRA